MPWAPNAAGRFNKKAVTKRQKKAFAKAANSVLAKGFDEGSAIRIGNVAANSAAPKLSGSGSAGMAKYAEKRMRQMGVTKSLGRRK